MSTPTTTMGKLGPMDVDRWMNDGHFGKRVLINGNDITNSCRWFDDQSGQALVLKQPIEYDYDGSVVTEMLDGDIEVKP